MMLVLSPHGWSGCFRFGSECTHLKRDVEVDDKRDVDVKLTDRLYIGLKEWAGEQCKFRFFANDP
jgi:hypothetical protein